MLSHQNKRSHPMNKILFYLAAASSPILSSIPANLAAVEAPGPRLDFAQDPKIAMQNQILAKVNGQTISMMDVKKKLDLLFHQHYPQHESSSQARFQFYESSWRPMLMQMIDNELILSDSVDKELKLTDGEVREEMENRFGPNVMQTLDKIGVTYEETWKMLKSEMSVQRMTWWNVHSRALQSVTPQDIRQAYRLYLQENPAYSEWKYRVVSIRTDKSEESLAEAVYQMLAEKCQGPEFLTDKLADELKVFEKAGIAIQVSNEFVAADKDLSELHKVSLSSLAPGSFSKPSYQMSRADKKNVYRIFYLLDKTDYPAPTFESLASRLRDDLVQKCIAKESNVYVEKLRKYYGFDAARIKETVPEDLHPFSLQ